MTILLILFLVLFLGTWLLCFLPQIRIFHKDRLPFAPRWARGGAMLCFCGLVGFKEDYKKSEELQRIARHEYCHQLQQRFLSPLGLAFLYFGEMVFRRIFINPDFKTAYWNVSWEKQAREYMNSKDHANDKNSRRIINV